MPLNTPITYEATQPFACAIAELLEGNLVVSEMAKNLRVGTVFIDWSQKADTIRIWPAAADCFMTNDVTDKFSSTDLMRSETSNL